MEPLLPSARVGPRAGGGRSIHGGGSWTRSPTSCGPGARGVSCPRWAVERTLSWITAHRRLARDYEANPAHFETMIRWGMIGIILRRLTRGGPASRPGPRPLARAAV
ncbi:hypothetical protein GCM10009665_27070 [Kitasatospora nipponensis]|uniref:DDE family transposase n=1 Tax=Kitasatospora nipponensis TaxID=258049 RepID=A0ABN1W4S6_9ACTN